MDLCFSYCLCLVLNIDLKLKVVLLHKKRFTCSIVSNLIPTKKKLGYQFASLRIILFQWRNSTLTYIILIFYLTTVRI